MKTRFVIFVSLGALLVLLWKFVLVALLGGAIIGGYYALKSPEPAVKRGPECVFVADSFICARMPTLEECADASKGSPVESACVYHQRQGHYRKDIERIDLMLDCLETPPRRSEAECEQIGKSK
jgi:hypothetical protein